jgi:drug/metabolite transporter (DMT)-like permease
MQFLIFAIAFSTLNHMLFRAFARRRIDLLSAIVVNYVVCVAIGYGSLVDSISWRSMFGLDWYPFSVVQGAMLVVCFYLIGLTTKKQGVAVASLASRLSVAIPTVLAFLLYKDTVTSLKVAGILAAIVALYLIGVENTGKTERLQAVKILPITLFVLFGLHSSLIKFVQAQYLDNASYHAYVMSAFFSALLISGAGLVWRICRKQYAGKWKDLISGLLLGCTNYGAVYFLIRTLGVPGWQSSQLFPTISIAVVCLSSIGARVVFNERLHRRVLRAIVIGVGAIILVNL